MSVLHTATAWLATRIHVLRQRGPDRGDVPGWVLVTAMTVALTLAVWAVAKTEIVNIVSKALSGVSF